MTVDRLYTIYNNSIKSIVGPGMLASLADRSNNIDGLGFINRVLIYIQNKYATFVRDDVSWFVAGRKPSEKASKIYTIEPTYTTRYIDGSTGEQLKKVQLSPIELENAIKFGVIRREKQMSGIKVVVMYNIKDTIIDKAPEYKEYTDKCSYELRLSDILSFIVNNFGTTCISDTVESTYDRESDTLAIGNDSFEAKIQAIVDCLNEHFEGGYEYTTSEADTERIKTICNTLTSESIWSMTPEYYTSAKAFDCVGDISQEAFETFIDRLSIQYDCIDSIVKSIKPRECLVDTNLVKRASEVVDIINAYEQYKKLRG